MCLCCLEKWKETSTSGTTHCPLCRAALPLDLGICRRLKRTIETLYPTAVAQRRIEQHEEAHPTKPPTPAPAPASSPSADVAYSMMAWQHYAMAAMYYGVNPFCYGPDAATAASVGTPVLAHVYQTTMNVQATSTAPTSSTTSCLPNPTRSADPAPPLFVDSSSTSEGNSLASCPPAPAEPWQAHADGPDRIKTAKSILDFLRSEGLDVGLGPAKLPSAVRFLELALYRKAPSKAAYLDPLTLGGRILEAVRERALSVRQAKAVAPSPSPSSSPLTDEPAAAIAV